MTYTTSFLVSRCVIFAVAYLMFAFLLCRFVALTCCSARVILMIPVMSTTFCGSLLYLLLNAI